MNYNLLKDTFKTWDQFQSEVDIWVKHNFPNHKSHQPLLGIIEELGELVDEVSNASKAQSSVADAVGDTMVYMADYCNCMGIMLRDLESLSNNIRSVFKLNDGITFHMILSITGQLCHAHLKLEQSIRGTSDMHLLNIKLNLCAIIVFLTYITMKETSFIQLKTCVGTIWNDVKKRDWTKNTVNGDTNINTNPTAEKGE